MTVNIEKNCKYHLKFKFIIYSTIEYSIGDLKQGTLVIVGLPTDDFQYKEQIPNIR